MIHHLTDLALDLITLPVLLLTWLACQLFGHRAMECAGELYCDRCGMWWTKKGWRV